MKLPPVCVLLPLIAPPRVPNQIYQMGKSAVAFPPGRTVAYLCGFISQQSGAPGGPALLGPIPPTQDGGKRQGGVLKTGGSKRGRFLPCASQPP